MISLPQAPLSDGQIRKTTVIKPISEAPWHAYQFSSSLHVQKHQIRHLPTKFDPNPSTLSVFQDFRFPPPTPPNFTGPGWDLK